jgi:hypothetical protein
VLSIFRQRRFVKATPAVEKLLVQGGGKRRGGELRDDKAGVQFFDGPGRREATA